MIRVVPFSGLNGSGKTSLILNLLDTMNERTGVIFNNERSLALATDRIPGLTATSFPLTAPCGRARQYSGRLETFMSLNDVDVIITEPAGPCIETMSPLLCPLVAFKKDSVSVSRLFNVLNGPEVVRKGVDTKTTEGLRVKQHIDESDVIVITFSDMMDDTDRTAVAQIISDINPDCSIVFLSNVTGEGLDDVKEIMCSGNTISRALVM